MSLAVYVAVGWLTMAFWTAVGARVTLGHVVPDAAIVVLVFVAMRREPIMVTLTAVGLGYFAGRQALAPIGLHEAVLVACALAVYMTAGNLAGSGARFYALACGGTVMLYHLLLYVVERLIGGAAGFTGWTTALLVPSGIATALLALASHPVLSAIEGKLGADRHEELSWD